MQTIASGIWQWLLRPGLERFEIGRDADEWLLRGTIVAMPDGGPTEATYEVRCDDRWNTRSADVMISDPSGRRAIHVANRDGLWTVNGAHAPQVDGCRDIDLGWTPSTNTIPIRRLNLPIGADSDPLTMAWVRFPDLTLEPLPQAYQRLEHSKYRYISRDGSFRAELTVDDDGVVVDYEGIWQRLPLRAP
jgi:hypothetical protein